MSTVTTERLYAAAQAAFREWLRAEGLRFPISHADVAMYLQLCARERGPTAVRTHRAAIGRLYRSRGIALDTKLL